MLLRVKKTKNYENRFSRLQDMTKDMTEVTELLWETVKQQNNKNNCKEKMENANENKDVNNSHHVDFVEINKLDEEIIKHVENNQSDNESMNKIVEKINIEHKKTYRKTLTIVRK